MILGLVTLKQLRAVCLPGTFGAAETQFDALLSTIGRGVSAQVETYCNRRFARVVDEREEFNGGRTYLSVTRYPVESVSMIEARDLGGIILPEWSDAGSRAGANPTNFGAGLIGIFRGCDVGTYEGEQLRITYTGGYFVADDPLDPVPDPAPDPDPTALPEGAKALPADLSLAVQLQCAHVFEACNYFGTAAIRTPGESGTPPLTQVELLPAVRLTLDGYARMSF